MINKYETLNKSVLKFMKPLLLIATQFLLNTSVILGQDIPQKTNSIVITDILSQGQFYNRIAEILFESGYGVLNTDKELVTITTTEKLFKNGVIKLVLLIKDKRVIMRGDFKTDIGWSMSSVTSEPTGSVIENKGARNSLYRNAWS
jgi:hypothetical protein